MNEIKNNPVKVEMKIRFSDNDMMGHVNNAVYLTFFEEARVEFYREAGFVMSNAYDFPFIIAEAYIKYLLPLSLGQDIYIEIGTAEIKKKSFKFNYRIIDKKTANITTLAWTIQVGYDYKNKKTREFDEKMIKNLKKFPLIFAFS